MTVAAVGAAAVAGTAAVVISTWTVTAGVISTASLRLNGPGSVETTGSEETTTQLVATADLMPYKGRLIIVEIEPVAVPEAQGQVTVVSRKGPVF